MASHLQVWLGQSCPSIVRRRGRFAPPKRVRRHSCRRRFPWRGQRCCDATKGVAPVLLVGGDADDTVAWTFLSKHFCWRGRRRYAGATAFLPSPCALVAWTFLSKHFRWRRRRRYAGATAFLPSRLRTRGLDSPVQAFSLAWTPSVRWCDGIPAVALTHSWLGQFCPSIFVGGDADATVAWTVLSKHFRRRGCRRYSGLDSLVQAKLVAGMLCAAKTGATTFLSSQVSLAGTAVLRRHERRRTCVVCWRGF